MQTMMAGQEVIGASGRRSSEHQEVEAVSQGTPTTPFSFRPPPQATPPPRRGEADQVQARTTAALTNQQQQEQFPTPALTQQTVQENPRDPSGNGNGGVTPYNSWQGGGTPSGGPLGATPPPPPPNGGSPYARMTPQRDSGGQPPNRPLQYKARQPKTLGLVNWWTGGLVDWLMWTG